MRPLVSVAVCAYNRRRFLPAATASIAAQTRRDWEILLVDDGSTDGTREWARRAAGRVPRLRYLRLPENRGPAAARNAAWRAARGRLMAWLDSDDVWYPRYLETMAGLLLGRRRAAVATCNYDLIDAAGRRSAERVIPPGHDANLEFRAVSGLGWIPKPSFTVVDRRRLGAAPPFDEGFRRYFEDVDFFFRAARRLGARAFVYRDEALGAYRRHGAQITRLSARALPAGSSLRRLKPWEHMDGPMVADVVDALRAGRPVMGARGGDFLLDMAYLGAKGGASSGARRMRSGLRR